MNDMTCSVGHLVAVALPPTGGRIAQLIDTRTRIVECVRQAEGSREYFELQRPQFYKDGNDHV
jgi:hypothetical protein